MHSKDLFTDEKREAKTVIQSLRERINKSDLSKYLIPRSLCILFNPADQTNVLGIGSTALQTLT